jgi:3-oxoacyl-(acyl-carrier-protein) synthase
VEIAGQLLCIKKSMFHPTINTEVQERGFELPLNKEPISVNWGDIFLKNSFAFGGHNASILFKAM